MRPLLWIAFSVALLWSVVGAFTASEFARARRARSGSTHCGCVNKDSCTEPCSACYGPNGYADCFKNPSPSLHVEPLEEVTVITSACCGGR